jgi:hypothetical protein
MSVAPVIANNLERLREAVLAISVTRLNVDRKRIANQLQELMFLVRPNVETDNAFGSAYAACCRLFETLKANEQSGSVESDAVRAVRREALCRVDALEQALSFAAPSDEAQVLGLDWCSEGMVGPQTKS